MSVIKQIRIRCDECGKISESSRVLTAAQFRNGLKQFGWNNQISRDFCPKCEEKIKKQKQEATQ